MYTYNGSLYFDFYLPFVFICRWFCHFDDDNYVNIPRLVHFLGDYNPREDWYLGKPSIQAPLEIINKYNVSRLVLLLFDIIRILFLSERYENIEGNKH